MTSSDELFGEQEASQESVKQEDQPAATEAQAKQQDVFSELVGEGKRYSDPAALAKAKIEADNHIKKIEEENAEYRKKLSSMDNNYSAILAKLEEKEKAHVSAKDNKDAEAKSDSKNNVDLDTWFESKLSQREQKLIQDANVKKARQLMIDTYGNADVAKKIFNELTTERPYMKDGFNQLLKTDPEKFIQEVKFFKSPASIGQYGLDPVGSVDNVHVDGSGKYITWSEANKVMKSDIKRYNSKEFQNLITESEKYFTQKGIKYFKS